MQNVLLDEIKKLSLSERILLVEEIWDDIVDDNGDSLSMSPEQQAELDRRIDRYEDKSDAGRCWQEIQQEYHRGNR